MGCICTQFPVAFGEDGKLDEEEELLSGWMEQETTNFFDSFFSH